MSKELEALRNNVDIKKALGFAQSCGYHADVQYALEKAVKLERLFTLMADLTNTNTPPTADELCEELGKYMNEPVWLDERKEIRISTQWLVRKIYYEGEYKGLNFLVVLPPRLIKRIAQFYENEVKE